MPHRGLSRSWRNAPLAQQRPERSSQGVNVERPAPFVGLVDPSGEQVAVEDSHQPGGNVEQRSLAQRTIRLTVWRASDASFRQRSPRQQSCQGYGCWGDASRRR